MPDAEGGKVSNDLSPEVSAKVFVKPIVVDGEPDAHIVKFKVGVQEFQIGGDYFEDKQHAEWFAEQFRIALLAFARPLLPPPASHEDDVNLISDLDYLIREYPMIGRGLERAKNAIQRLQRTATPRVITPVFVICNAYESGYGHGMQADKLLNPYSLGSNEYEAYSIGYSEGFDKQSQASSSPPVEPVAPPLAGIDQYAIHKAFGDYARRRTSMENILDVLDAISSLLRPPEPEAGYVADGWSLNAADFSLQAAGQSNVGRVTLIRSTKARALWHRLSDEARESDSGPPLYVYGTGKTIVEAIRNANIAAESALPLGETDSVHASDCATNNAPALPVGPCNCGKGE